MKLIFPEAVLNQHLVVLGKTGAGKSSALRHIAEHLLTKGKRVCIVDPKGDWYGLKAPGTGPGFPVVLFGDFKNPDASDVPVYEVSGKPVAELVTGGNRPSVVGFRGWTQGAMHRFWIDFASTLFNTNGGELYLIIDEVHNFAPKGKVLSPEVGKCLHWSNRIMNEGRGIGLINLIASQRPQKVHNDTLTACETLVAMRVIHKADRDAVEDWIKGCGDPKQGAQVLSTLASMKRSEAYVWSPEVAFGPERLAFPMFTTYDSFAPPQLLKAVNKKGWAEVDLELVKARLSEAIEKAKAEDPKELNKIIAGLRREITDLKRNVAPREQDTQRITQLEEQLRAVRANPLGKPKVVDKMVVIERHLEAASRVADKAQKLADSLREQTSSMDSIVGNVKSAITKAHEVNVQTLAVPAPVSAPAVRRPLTTAIGPAGLSRPSAPVISPQQVNGISGVAQKILNALAEFEAISKTAPPKVLIGFMCGYSNLASKSFANAMGSLRTSGYISYPEPGAMQLTQAGRRLAPAHAAPLSTDDMLQRIKDLLGGVSRKIVDELVPIYPNALSKSELASNCGYENVASKSFANALGRLRTLGFVDYPQPGTVAATSLLFPEGE